MRLFFLRAWIVINFSLISKDKTKGNSKTNPNKAEVTSNCDKN